MLPAVFFYIEVDTTAYLIGISRIEYLFNHFDLLQDVAGGSGFNAGRKGIKKCQYFMKAEGIFLHDLHRLELLQFGFFRKLVLTFITVPLQVPRIGYIPHITHLVAEMKQITVDQIKRDECAAIA